MTDISANFRTFLLADSTLKEKVGGRIHALKVPQSKTPLLTPFVWFRKRQAQCLDVMSTTEAADPFDFYFDVECVAMNNESLALEVADLVRSRCSAKANITFGDTTAKGVFVNDQDDDYENQSTGGDDRFAVAALDVRVVT